MYGVCNTVKTFVANLCVSKRMMNVTENVIVFVYASFQTLFNKCLILGHQRLLDFD